MRILFTPFPLPTHYFPMVTLGWALRAAGHDVRVVAQPTVMDAVIASGLPAIAVSSDYDLIGQMPALHRKRRELEEAGQRLDVAALRAMAFDPHSMAAASTADQYVAIAQRWRPDLVISDPLVLAAPLAADLVGAALVSHLWGPDLMRMLGFPGAGLPVDEWPESLLRTYRRFGVAPRQDFAVCTVDPCPTSMQVPGIPARLPVRFVPYNGPGEVPGWASERAGRPRVCLCWGTVVSDRSDEEFLVPRVLDALEGLDVEVVATVKKGDRAKLGESAAGVRVAEELPLHVFLPSCDAIIHHGGTGTIQTAAYCGVPQLAVPSAPDHQFNAAQLAATGSGVCMAPDDLTVDSVKASVHRLIDGREVRESAQRFQQEILATPAPAEIVGDLLALV